VAKEVEEEVVDTEPQSVVEVGVDTEPQSEVEEISEVSYLFMQSLLIAYANPNVIHDQSNCHNHILYTQVAKEVEEVGVDTEPQSVVEEISEASYIFFCMPFYI
jgi:hypothetical protein